MRDRASRSPTRRIGMKTGGRRAAVFAAALMLASAAPSISAAQSYGTYGAERFFTVESETGERRGRPVVRGYVTSQYGFGVRDVRLRVEALDAADAVVSTQIGYVNGLVLSGGRVYFEVPVTERALKYRVTVLSFDVFQGRG
jgi:hypothetical protein